MEKEISEIIDKLTDRLDISEKLIFILKQANAEKDILINKQGSDLVSLNHQIAEHNKIFNDMTKIIGNLENE